MKKIFTLLSAALLAVGMGTTAFAADINVTVDGTPVAWTDAKPFINEDDRTLVPLRPIANALGLTVNWNDDTNTASFTDGETTAEFTVGSSEYHVFLNDFDMQVYLEMDTEPAIADSRIYAPARYLAEAFQYTVGWNEPTKTVSITSSETDAPAVSVEAAAFAPDMTVAAGEEVIIPVTLTGVEVLEDFDFFTYELAYMGYPETLSSGAEYTYLEENGIIYLDLQPAFDAKPGDYNCSVLIPAEWFASGTDKYLSADFTLTVTEASPSVALDAALSNIEYGVYVPSGTQENELTAIIEENAGWPFFDTALSLEAVTENYDVLNSEWTGTLIVTNTETSESAEMDVVVPIEFYAFD